MRILIYLFSALLLWSCNSVQEKKPTTGKNSPTTKTGRITYTENEILIVLDTALWKAPIGDTIRAIFEREPYGLPRPERNYKLIRINGNAFKGYLNEYQNIILIVNKNSESSSDRYLKKVLGEENINTISNTKDKFTAKQNVYITEQNMIIVVADSKEEISKILSDNGKRFLNYFDKQVNDYLQRRIFSAPAVETSKKLPIRIPKGYQKAKENDSLSWYRVPDKEIDKNIVIAQRPYISESQFSDSSINRWKLDIGKTLLDETDSLSVQIQDYMPLVCEISTLNDDYSKLCSGLWKLSDNGMGGPFVSYVFLSYDKSTIYYTEGFLIAPGKDKRKEMRELKAIITNVGKNY